MTKIKLYAASLAMACSLPFAGVWADDRKMGQAGVAATETEAAAIDMDGQPIAGYMLMTPQEKQRREAYRALHRDRMTQRARSQGMDPEDIANLPATAAGREALASDDMNRDDPLSEGEGEVQ